MANRIRWVDREWRFDFSADLYPEVVARLAGGPARVEEIVRVAGGDRGVLTRREGEGTWSIQENIGHLGDLDELTMGRLDDYEAGLAVLRVADMTNAKTHKAGHNEREIGAVLAAFRAGREAMVGRLDGTTPGMFSRVARHPRLDRPMRMVDLLYFWAEHDDYHVARMRELLRVFG